MKRRHFLFGIFVGLAAVSASGPAEADDLSLNISGSFGPTTTLSGIPLGVATPFAFSAVFDRSQELFHTDHVGIFAVTQFTVTIAGHGTFTGIPNENLNVAISDPAYPPVMSYSAGLVNRMASSFFLDKYSTVSTPFDPHMPTPTTFVDFLGREAGAFPYVIPLAGGTGELAINDFGSSVPLASLSPVPEPLQLLMAGLFSTTLFPQRIANRRPRPRSP
jgi:hypothetical protein